MHFIEEVVWECNYTVAKRLFWASNVFGYCISLSPLKTWIWILLWSQMKARGLCFPLPCRKFPIVKLLPQKKMVQPLVVLNEKLQMEYQDTDLSWGMLADWEGSFWNICLEYVSACQIIVNCNFINKILKLKIPKEWTEKKPSNKEESPGIKLTNWAAKLHISPRTVNK